MDLQGFKVVREFLYGFYRDVLGSSFSEWLRLSGFRGLFSGLRGSGFRREKTVAPICFNGYTDIPDEVM